MHNSVQLAVAAAAIAIGTGGSAAASTEPPIDDPTFAGLFVLGDVPVIPEGAPGELVVAMDGQGSGSIAPVIVRNNTDATVYDVVVSGIARDETGTLIATGESQQMVPYAVPPGGIAFSYVYFEAGFGEFEVMVTDAEGQVVSEGGDGSETFEYQARASEADSAGLATLPISEATIVERDVVGLVQNPGTEAVPEALVSLACFNDLGELTYAYWDRVDGITPGGFMGFTLPSGEDCTSAVVAASG